MAAFILFCTPALARTEHTSMEKQDKGYIIHITDGLEPGKGHYMVITANAKNPNREDYPRGTALITWAGGQERARINIDDLSHRYYVPLGRNSAWDGAHGIDDLALELPGFEGIDIQVQDVKIKNRIFFPVDIYISGLIDSPLIPGYAQLNSFLIPSYILTVLLLAMACLYYLMFRKHPSGDISQGRLVKKAVFFLILLILLFFSFTYIYDQALVVKSYWTAYGDDLVQGNMAETYMGIYDFERFIAWADDKIPSDQGVILFVRGEPVYIMSEMAYNMYPRDIRFVNISGKTYDEVQDDLGEPARVSGEKYDYLIILSEDDTNLAFRYELIAQYRSNGGYIYSLK